MSPRRALDLVSYATRPLLWAILAAIVCFGAMSWVMDSKPNLVFAYTGWPKLRLIVDFPPDLESIRARRPAR